MELVARDPVPWLLDPGNPSVRVLALKHIFKRGPTELAEDQQRLLDWKPVAALRRHWDSINFWGRSDNPYFGGPVGNFGTLYLFAQLGVPRRSEIASACENLLTRGRHSEGYFAPQDVSAAPWLSFNGIALQVLTHFGYGDDPGALDAWNVMLTAFGSAPDHLGCALADRACRAGAVKALGALIHRNETQPTDRDAKAIEILCDYLLKHDYAWEGEDADWLLPRFPRYYDADIIELCHVLAHTPARDHPRAQAILRRMLALQDSLGRWSKMKTTPALSEERVLQPSRWLTFEAVHSLMLTYGDNAYAT